MPPSGVSSVPGGSGGPSSAQRPPNAPEDDSIQPYVRVNAPEQPSAAPPSGTGGTPPGTPMPPRVLRPSPPNAGALGGPNREWVPLAIGAVVLLFCAILLYFGGRFALSAMGTPSTPTRPAVAVIPTSTVMPTAVQLPTQPVATAVSTTVTAKVNENRVNVRTGPSTKDKIITVVTRGTQLTLLGKNDAGDWYQIIAPKSTNKAWVSALTVDIVSGDPASLPVVPAGGTTAAPTAKPKATATKAP
ncbi:MAG: SH3 domain-containing protein [Chloroflexi bacterium]|nr:SH3 domain-containing protein [Chloroflexota bacterium]